jgi:Fe-S-cluster containining protein
MGAAPPRFSHIERRARDAAAKALAQSPAAAARAAIAEADAFLAEIADAVGLHDRLASLACDKGCASCCHQMVGVTSAELALLAEAVATLPDPGAVIARVQETARRSAGFSVAQWWAARLACPLLDETGACLVHAARPLPCRAMNSADAQVCRRAFAGEEDARRIPVLAAQHGVYGHAQAGLANAVDGGAVPLAAGLAEIYMTRTSAAAAPASVAITTGDSSPAPSGSSSNRSVSASKDT